MVCPAGFRTFKITNTSAKTIWLGVNSGAQPAPGTGCGPGNTCSVPGTACSTLANPPNCFYVATNPGEIQACSQTSPLCPAGQLCNTSLGLCQWQLAYDYSHSCASQVCPAGETCDAALKICLKSSYSIPNDELEVSPGGQKFLCLPAQPSAVGLKPGASCTKNSQCASGLCNFYPPGGAVQACNGGTNCVCGPINPFSGGIYARTGCQPDGTNCHAGDCENAPYQPCPLGIGAGNPASQAEFTLSEYSQDFYDVTVINGANSAIAMAPDPNSTPAPVPTSQTTPQAQYWCKAPGSASAQGSLPGCGWKFDTTDVSGGDRTALLTQIALPVCSNPAPNIVNPLADQVGCPLGSVCQPNGAGTYFCMPDLKTCTNPSQCPGSMPCVNGFCSPIGKCAGATDCPVGSACVNGLCDGVGCSSDSDCSVAKVNLESATCLSEPVNPSGTSKVCVPLTCDSNVQCPTGFVCSAGACEPGTTSCSLTNPCPSSRQACDIKSGTCVTTPYCSIDGVCPSGNVCGPNNTCIPGGVACLTGQTCPDGSACPPGGFCPGACASDSECAAVAGTCVNGACQPLTYDSSTDCPTGYSKFSPAAGRGPCVLSCTAAADCTQSQYGNICGSGLYNASLIQTCGASTGAVWSMDDFCGTQPAQTFGNINCGAIAQTTASGSDTFANMFGCNGNSEGSAVSCYNDPNNYSTCCGCPTFPAGSSGSWPTPWNLTVATMSCQNTTNNSTWIDNILPWLQYLKAACPTAYSFPFDDATSTFQCDSAGTFLPPPSATPSATPVANAMNYDITFSAIGINATPAPGPTP